MYFVHYRMVDEITKQRVREAETRAEREQLLREAGIEPQGRLRWLAGRALNAAGRRLVVWGEWLEQAGRSQPVCIERSLGTQR